MIELAVCHTGADVRANAAAVKKRLARLWVMPPKPAPVVVPPTPEPPVAAPEPARPVEWANVTQRPIALIQQLVGEFYGLTRTAFLSSRRHTRLVRARQVAMTLAAQTTAASLPEIGRRFRDRDHTTVLHAVTKITALRLVDRELDDEIRYLAGVIEGWTQWHKSPWQEIPDSQLAELIAQRLSASQIGTILHVSRNAVIGRAYRLGIRLISQEGRPKRDRSTRRRRGP